MFSLRTWRKTSEERRGFELSNEDSHGLSKESLPKIPRAVTTSMRTSVRGQGASNPLSMHSHSQPTGGDDVTICGLGALTNIVKLSEHSTTAPGTERAR